MGTPAHALYQTLKYWRSAGVSHIEINESSPGEEEEVVDSSFFDQKMT